MRTFHIGGAAQRGAEQSSVEAPVDATVSVKNRNVVMNSEGRAGGDGPQPGDRPLDDENGRERARHRVPYGAKLLVDDGAKVKGRPLAEWDPYTLPIITEKEGIANFVDLVEGVSMREVTDETTGIANRVVIDWKQQPQGQRSEAAHHLARRQGRGDHAGQRPGGALLHVGRRDPVGRQRRQGQGRRRAGADPAGDHQDPRHHRRSAAGGRAVRGPQAEGLCDHQRIAGRVEFGKDYKTKRRIVVVPEEDGAEPAST